MERIRVRRTGPPEVMEMEEAELPPPGRAQVRVAVRAAGVNPVDTYVRGGTYGYSPELPYTPGADGAGIVEQVGSGVTRVRVGQRVYGGRCGTGSYAELALFEETQVFPLPERVSFQEGACLGIPYGTAYRALFQKARVQPGETALIHGGSGGVGSAAVQLARVAKLQVIATAGSERGLELLKQLGAEYALDHRSPAHFDELMRITRGHGADVIVELLANENLGRDLQVVAKFGRIVVIGSRGSVQVDPRDAMQRDATVLGMVLKNTPPEEFAQIHSALAPMLASGAIKPVVGRELPLAEAPEAHRAVMTPPAYGNIVLIP